MNQNNQSFKEQWATVAAMTENRPFITGRPVIHTSGSMSTAKESFFMRYVLSFGCILLGLMALAAVIYNLQKETDQESLILFLVLLLGVLFLFFGVSRILSVHRICWNTSGSYIYLYYGRLWTRRILQIPRESLQIKMSVAGPKKWHSYFFHGDTILSLELKNRSGMYPIHLLASSSRDLLSDIAGQLSAIHIAVEDSSLAEETISGGRTICFPRTGIGSTLTQCSNIRINLVQREGRVIVGRTMYQMMFVMAFVVLGIIGLVVMAKLRHDWSMCFVGSGTLMLLVIGIVGWFPGFGTTILVDSEKADVIVRRGFWGAGPKRKNIAFGSIVGVQVCPRHVEDEDESTIFELNLVIQSEPNIERFHLWADGDNAKVISYAQKIGAAMNKPVFDHSLVKKKTLDDTIIL